MQYKLDYNKIILTFNIIPFIIILRLKNLNTFFLYGNCNFNFMSIIL